MAKKDNAPTDNSQQLVNESKIEAIKNLIFGENIQEYNHEFENLKADIESKREELLDYVDNTRKELATAIDNLGTDMSLRLSDLEESLNDKTADLEDRKMSRDTLGSMLIKLGEKIKE